MHYILPVVLWSVINEMLMGYIEMNIWVKTKMRQSSDRVFSRPVTLLVVTMETVGQTSKPDDRVSPLSHH